MFTRNSFLKVGQPQIFCPDYADAQTRKNWGAPAFCANMKHL